MFNYEFIGSFRNNGKVDDHSICLEPGGYYTFEIPKISNVEYKEEELLIGTFVCGKFVAPGETIYMKFSVRNNQCTASTTEFVPPNNNYDSLYNMKNGILTKNKQQNNNKIGGGGVKVLDNFFSYPYSVLMSGAMPLPIPVPFTKSEQCMHTCGYGNWWLLKDYCHFYKKSCSLTEGKAMVNNIINPISQHNCVPDCLQIDKSCSGSTFCEEFGSLSLSCSNPKIISFPTLDNLKQNCIDSYLKKITMNNENMVTYQLSFSATLMITLSSLQNIEVPQIAQDNLAMKVFQTAVANSIHGVFFNDVSILLKPSDHSINSIQAQDNKLHSTIETIQINIRVNMLNLDYDDSTLHLASQTTDGISNLAHTSYIIILKQLTKNINNGKFNKIMNTAIEQYQTKTLSYITCKTVANSLVQFGGYKVDIINKKEENIEERGISNRNVFLSYFDPNNGSTFIGAVVIVIIIGIIVVLLTLCFVSYFPNFINSMKKNNSKEEANVKRNESNGDILQENMKLFNISWLNQLLVNSNKDYNLKYRKAAKKYIKVPLILKPNSFVRSPSEKF